MKVETKWLWGAIGSTLFIGSVAVIIAVVAGLAWRHTDVQIHWMTTVLLAAWLIRGGLERRA